jgi:hypothetical protein
MSRHSVIGGVSRETVKSISSVACLAFVVVLALAFWAGALWIGNTLLRMLSL